MAGNATFTIWNRMGGTLKSESYYTALYEFGNTRFRGTDSGTGNALAVGTKHMHSGKWYFEFLISGSPAGGWPAVGLIAATDVGDAQNGGNPQFESIFSWVRATDGKVKAFGGTTSATYGTSFSDGDIFNMAVDIDNGKCFWGKNNTYFNSGNPATGTNAGQTFTAGTDMAIQMMSYVGAGKLIINSGQDSNFSGEKSTGTNSAADANGYGDFYYAPPTGFLSLNSANLPTSSDIDPATTDSDHPQKNFGAVTYTGNAGTNAITGVGFQPDLVWIKISNTASNGPLVDSSRGANKPIFSQVTNAEVTSGNLASFDSDGFTVNNTSDYLANFNGDTNSYVAWCWRANGGTTSTNTSGTITSTVQANTAGGFSIVQYTGTGTNSTVGHGLSAAPEYMIIKNLDTTDNWINYNKVGGAANRGQLNSGSYGTSTTSFQSTDPSATVITLGTSSGVNSSTHDFIAYCWHGVEGYSKFGLYEGNGNEDGPFIYTGFRPKLVSMIRSTGGSYNVFDSARFIHNPIDAYLQWTAHDAQTTGYPLHFFGNGFKIRTNGTGINQDGTDFYYAAWGDNPYKYGQGF